MANAQAIPRKAGRGLLAFKWTLLGPFFGLLLFILPAFLLQLYFSFHSWTIYLGSWWDAEFVGLGVFRDVLGDSRFWWSVLRSLIFASLSTLGCFVAGFALALAMHRPFRGHSLLYAVFILPMLTVPVVVAYTFEMLLFQRGPINGILITILNTNVTDTRLAQP
ncbi:MAG: sugar ABC transporter permease, partial [Candidatus Tectomicrobia bacterium]|nr:sugar ABC transporter permease [Candidatus Tectomicrobia bacterium]